jgi:hypothetical protein
MMAKKEKQLQTIEVQIHLGWLPRRQVCCVVDFNVPPLLAKDPSRLAPLGISNFFHGHSAPNAS